MSESVYRGLCLKVGTQQQVVIRREITDLEEIMHRKIENLSSDALYMMISGSYREGFRMDNSDIDIMFWYSGLRVVTDVTQCVYYDISNKNILLADSSESPPGYALLQLLSPIELDMQLPLVNINDRIYICCSYFKEIFSSTDDFFFKCTWSLFYLFYKREGDGFCMLFCW